MFDSLKHDHFFRVKKYAFKIEQFSRIDWMALKEDDPIEYVTKRDEYREAQARIQHAQKLQHQAAEEAHQERAQLLQQHVAQEHKLLEINA